MKCRTGKIRLKLLNFQTIAEILGLNQPIFISLIVKYYVQKLKKNSNTIIEAFKSLLMLNLYQGLHVTSSSVSRKNKGKNPKIL